MKFDITVKDCNAEEALRIIGVAKDANLADIQERSFGISAPVHNTVVQNHVATVEDEGNAAPANGIDANGFPWDGRIHSSNHKTSAKGVWMKRRGVDDATIAAVEAELRNQTPAAPVSPPPFVPPALGAPFTPTPNVPPLAAPQAPSPVFTPPAAPVFTPPAQPFNAPVFTPPAPFLPPVQPAQEGPITYQTIIDKISSLFQQQKITPEYVTNLCAKLGCGSITEIAGNDSVIQYAVSVMKQEGNW